MKSWSNYPIMTALMRDIVFVLILKVLLLVGLFQLNFTHPVEHTPNRMAQHLLMNNIGASS